MIAALAFVPTYNVLDYYLQLHNYVQRSPNMEVSRAALDVLDYFGRSYVGIDVGGNQILPLFPPKLWNSVMLLQQDGPRSNNLVEGWHNRFNKKVGCSKPNVWKVLREAVREEQQYFERYYAMVTAGRGTSRKRAEDVKDERLKRVSLMFSTLSFDDYSKGIANAFRNCD